MIRWPARLWPRAAGLSPGGSRTVGLLGPGPSGYPPPPGLNPSEHHPGKQRRFPGSLGYEGLAGPFPEEGIWSLAAGCVSEQAGIISRGVLWVSSALVLLISAPISVAITPPLGYQAYCLGGVGHRGYLRPLLLHRAIPPGVTRLIVGSVGGAMAVARNLPVQEGRPLADAARQAFISGMDLGLLIGCAIVGVAALVVLFALPNRSTSRR